MKAEAESSKKEEGSMYRLCNEPRAREREAEKLTEERERKWEKEETCGPSNGNKLGPT
jgi:hypothetical protein